jgi:UDP-N-acetyl-D-galactosamine dehydrogenase
MNNEYRIAVIGMGYVGLPLAIEFAKKYRVIGFDINEKRVKDLLAGKDETNEADLEALKEVASVSSLKKSLLFSNQLSDIQNCNIYVVTVPTPVNQYKAPDLSYLLRLREC